MTAQPKQGSLSVDDWLCYDVPEGLHAELVDGVLEMNPLAEPPHQILLHQLIRQIEVFLFLHPNDQIWWSSPGRLPIPGMRSGREPDLAIYDGYPHLPAGPMAWKDLPPIVVVEAVSEGQEARDYVDKRREYFLAKIPEYWIADLGRKLFLALRRGEAGWNEIQFGESGTYTTPLLPGFELDISKLWQPPVPPPPVRKGERSERPRGARADSSQEANPPAKKRVKRPR